MATEQQENVYDLLIVADATASMQTFLTSLCISLPQIISVSALTNCFSRIGLLYYRDYDMPYPLEWHGWIEPSKLGTPDERHQPDLVSIARNVRAEGGADYAEATKTALAKVYEVSRAEATTIVMLYTDAPPHTTTTDKMGVGYGVKERMVLLMDESAIHKRYFADWVSACDTLRNGGKRIHTYTVIDHGMNDEYLSLYTYLSTVTGGACIHLKKNSDRSTVISRITVELLLAWMGVEKAGLSDEAKNKDLGAMLTRYIDISKIKKVTSEARGEALGFFSPGVRDNTTKITATPDTLRKYLPATKTPIAEFTQQWKNDEKYRELAIIHLQRIIRYDVRALALNPVLGSLWRVFCNDRTISNREAVLASFSQGVTRLSNETEREQMKAWLEESYDFVAQIQETVETVPKEARFPCVYLDPTLKFEQADVSIGNDDEDANRAITEFRRNELLEIGRSCDYKILRRLGRVLTRLTYVEKASDMPLHIAQTTDEDVPKIPVALASEEYDRSFWGVLLHAVLPGTLLAARPATLLAALSLRMGVEPLREAAEHQMMAWKTKWNDIEVSETWNIGCLTLLLDADKAYRQRRESLGQEIEEGLLLTDDRRLFETLVDLKILERNLDTPLVAKVGWTPNKSFLPMGPVVVCRTCKFPRSVTIMGKSGQCGLCLADDYKSEKERLTAVATNVFRDDNELTEATWVECSVITCRTQYIVYHQDALRTRAKCHYCRSQKYLPDSQRSASPAPTVECRRCLNRMIFPKAYRQSTFSESFLCVACTSNRETITEIETNATQISNENTTDWLAVDAQVPSKSPFSNRSVYHTITTIGTGTFLSRLKLFPKTDGPLRRRGKVIHNSQELIEKLQKQVSRRHAERVSCSLCFSDFLPRDLNAACGRRGCLQRICRGCLDGWYGLNSAGCILNVASLFCAFCRRQPRAQTLAKHGMGVHSVGNLAHAVRDQGQWIYAWCETCAYAKPFVERVCARGVPADITHWTCEECHEQQAREEEARRLAELEDRRVAARIQGDIRAAGEVERNRRRFLEKREARIQSKRKPCPGCGVECVKSMGCGHMTCPVPKCLTHWCFFCGKKFDRRSIYNHMNTAHGGLFGGDSEGEEE